MNSYKCSETELTPIVRAQRFMSLLAAVVLIATAALKVINVVVTPNSDVNPVLGLPNSIVFICVSIVEALVGMFLLVKSTCLYATGVLFGF
jgi:hypothetical protein